MIPESLIDQITELANKDEIIKQLESHVAFHQTIEMWMTRRVLYSVYSLALLDKEMKK